MSSTFDLEAYRRLPLADAALRLLSFATDDALLNGVFEGSAKRLVAHLLREGTLGERERQDVLDLIAATPEVEPSPEKRKKGGRR